MSVKPVDLENGQTPDEQHRARRMQRQQERGIKAALFWSGLGWRALGLLMLVMGAGLWLLGARYSIDGWARGLTMLGAIAQLPIQVQPPQGTDAYIPVVLIGLMYSFAEIKVRPTWDIGRIAGPQAFVIILMGVLLIHGSDIGSTFLALSSPGADAWPVHVWAAQQGAPLALWAIILTYVPEMLILFGKRLLLGEPLR